MLPHTTARETADARYDAAYQGTVVDTADPAGRGCVRVRVPGLHGEAGSVWAKPIGPMFGEGSGFHAVPEVGSNVVVWFLQGDVDCPIYSPGIFTKPGGVSSAPESVQNGSPEKVTLRWRDFEILFDGTPGSERLTITDEPGGSTIYLDRTTRDVVRTAGRDENQTVTRNLTVAIQTGSETRQIPLGGRTTTMLQDDSRTIAAGNDVLTLALGSQVETGILGSSTETWGLGKIITSLLGVAITAAGVASLIAGGAVTIAGAAVTLQSAGPATSIAAGLSTRQFLGGIVDTIVGAVSKTITGTYSLVCSGSWSTTASTAEIVSADVKLGTGPYKRFVTEEVFAAWANTHTHGGGAPDQLVIDGGSSPNVDTADVTSAEVTGS